MKSAFSVITKIVFLFMNFTGSEMTFQHTRKRRMLRISRTQGTSDWFNLSFSYQQSSHDAIDLSQITFRHARKRRNFRTQGTSLVQLVWVLFRFIPVSFRVVPVYSGIILVHFFHSGVIPPYSGLSWYIPFGSS